VQGKDTVQAFRSGRFSGAEKILQGPPGAGREVDPIPGELDGYGHGFVITRRGSSVDHPVAVHKNFLGGEGRSPSLDHGGDGSIRDLFHGGGPLGREIEGRFPSLQVNGVISFRAPEAGPFPLRGIVDIETTSDQSSSEGPEPSRLAGRGRGA